MSHTSGDVAVAQHAFAVARIGLSWRALVKKNASRPRLIIRTSHCRLLTHLRWGVEAYG
jgi:hypothetical protein